MIQKVGRWQTISVCASHTVQQQHKALLINH